MDDHFSIESDADYECSDVCAATGARPRYETSLAKCGDRSLDRNGAVMQR
jgi:hypothetical protein